VYVWRAGQYTPRNENSGFPSLILPIGKRVLWTTPLLAMQRAGICAKLSHTALARVSISTEFIITTLYLEILFIIGTFGPSHTPETV
jgi:hypothetical protein